MRFLLGLFLMALSIHAEIVGEVRMTVDAGDLPAAGRLVADYCKAHGTTPDVIFANSWIARGYLERGKLDDADKNAMETRAWALTLVMHRKLDAEPVLKRSRFCAAKKPVGPPAACARASRRT